LLNKNKDMDLEWRIEINMAFIGARWLYKAAGGAYKGKRETRGVSDLVVAF